MSDIGIVTSGNDNDLFEIEVGLMLSEALKEAGTVLMLQKGKKALLGGGKKDATLARLISGGGEEKTLEVTIGTRASQDLRQRICLPTRLRWHRQVAGQGGSADS